MSIRHVSIPHINDPDSYENDPGLLKLFVSDLPGFNLLRVH